MARRRPPTLRTLAYRAIRDHGLLVRDELVLCACSGGPDSNALLHVLASLRDRVGFRLAAAGVDHGLREEAAAELDVVQALAEAHDVPFHRQRIAIAPGPNLQARAREGRHQALQTLAERLAAGAIALGHTADDRAETMMMRILRGTGARGLAAMPPKTAEPPWGQIPLVRPILTARRSDVTAHLTRQRIGFASDPSNQDARFLRVRVRRQLMPLLEELSPGVVGHLCSLSDAMLEAALLAAAHSAGPDPLIGLNRAQREALNRAIRLKKGGATVRVSGGRELRVAFFQGTPVVFIEG